MKLAGIVEPNDGLCHLENKRYSHSLKQVTYLKQMSINTISKINLFLKGLSVDWRD